MGFVRPAAVAGTFYPGDAQELSRMVGGYLDKVQVPDSEKPPKAIIAPHAGLIYSGPIAASVFRRIAPLREVIKRVVLIGPAHRVAVRGLAVSGADAFTTPLGSVPVDKEAVLSVLQLPHVEIVRSPVQLAA